MNPPRADLSQNLTGREEGPACFGLVVTVLANKSSLLLSGARVLGFGNADNMHHLVVGANGVFDNGLGLGVVDATLLIIAALRLPWVCLPLALDDIVVGGAALGRKSVRGYMAVDSVSSLPAPAMSEARGGPWCKDGPLRRVGRMLEALSSRAASSYGPLTRSFHRNVGLVKKSWRD